MCKSKYRYFLDDSSEKFICPNCDEKRFVLYIDSNTGEYLPEEYGRCDREDKCGYHLNPYKDDYENIADPDSIKKWEAFFQKSFKGNDDSTLSSIPFKFLQKSRNCYEHNKFVIWLTTLFDQNTVNELIARYHIGTSSHWPGATIFWQIDAQGIIRSGKIMLYNAANGRRVKEPRSYITWVHTVLNLENFKLDQCLFGEHLLSQFPGRSVAIVESEKTAIIAQAYLPQHIWLASGSLSNLQVERCQSLINRKVHLFPDCNAYEKWRIKAKELSKEIPNASFIVSDLLEKHANEYSRNEGLDLADFLIRFDMHELQNSDEATPASPKTFYELTKDEIDWYIDEDESRQLEAALWWEKAESRH
jgi:hypothetical protein